MKNLPFLAITNDTDLPIIKNILIIIKSFNSLLLCPSTRIVMASGSTPAVSPSVGSIVYSIYIQSCPGIYAPENCGNGEEDLDHAVLVVGSVISNSSDMLKL